MLDKQDRRCAICKTNDPKSKNERGWAVDHCHKTGKVRGVLCSPCNAGLGLLATDDPIVAVVRFARAIKYLQGEDV